MGGRGAGSNMGGSNAVTPTSIPSLSVDNIQKFVDQFGTNMSVEQMVDKVYAALPNVGTFTGIGGVTTDKGVSVINNRYLSIEGGPTLQFIRQKSNNSWKVKILQ